MSSNNGNGKGVVARSLLEKWSITKLLNSGVTEVIINRPKEIIRNFIRLEKGKK